MNKIICMLTVSLASLMCLAQSEPEFEMEPYMFDNTDSSFVTPLPCEKATLKVKMAGAMLTMGMGKTSAYFYIKGEGSPLVIDKKTKSIIINTGGMSPQQNLNIIRLEEVKKYRRWKMMETSIVSGTKDKEEDFSMPLKYKKYHTNSVLIDTSELESGEYCIVIKSSASYNSINAYTFKIR